MQPLLIVLITVTDDEGKRRLKPCDLNSINRQFARVDRLPLAGFYFAVNENIFSRAGRFMFMSLWCVSCVLLHMDGAIIGLFTKALQCCGQKTWLFIEKKNRVRAPSGPMKWQALLKHEGYTNGFCSGQHISKFSKTQLIHYFKRTLKVEIPMNEYLI